VISGKLFYESFTSGKQQHFEKLPRLAIKDYFNIRKKSWKPKNHTILLAHIKTLKKVKNRVKNVICLFPESKIA